MDRACHGSTQPVEIKIVFVVAEWLFDMFRTISLSVF